MPLTFCLDCNISFKDAIPEIRTFTQWYKVTDRHIASFQLEIDFMLHDYVNEGLYCHEQNCTNVRHRQLLNESYEYFLSCLLISSNEFPTRLQSNKFRPVAGWNDHCKDKYTVARNNFVSWVESGRVRSGACFEQMKQSRKEFKNALNFCTQNELNIY